MKRGDLKRFSEAVVALQECQSPADVSHALLRGSEILLDADIHAVNWMGSGEFKDVSARTVELPCEASLDVVNAHIAEHPLYWEIQESERAGRWSDYTTLRAFGQTALYNEFFRRTETRYQLAVTIRATAEHAVALSFNRKSSDFRSGEVELLEMFTSHVLHTMRAMVGRFEVEKGLALRDLAMGGNAVAIASVDGAIIFATEAARRLLREHFPNSSAELLPPELRAWVGRTSSHSETFLREGAGARLICSCKPATPWHWPPSSVYAGGTKEAGPNTVRCLTLREESEVEAARKLQRLGLTPREAEVLYWVGQGKRNTEIATILELSSRTVDKHTEHIFAKLGAETRASAVAFALECLRLP